jgi:hypothetical protein
LTNLNLRGRILTRAIVKIDRLEVWGDCMTLEEAWAEFQETAADGGVHVGMLEAQQILREVTRKSRGVSQPELTPEQEAHGRFLDWLLHVKQDKGLAYELLQKVGTTTVGPRQYWTTTQGKRRAIAWESRYTYPGSDSEIWDVILVDEDR